MAYPYQITSAAKLPKTFLDPGPHVRGSSIYTVLHDRTNHHAEVWRSTDAGQNWSEQDSGNHKTVQSSPAANDIIDTFPEGTDSLHLLLVDGSGNLNIAPFSRASNTFGTLITGGPAPQFARINMLVRRSDGSYVVVYTTDVSSNRQLNLVTCTSGGTWGTPITVMVPGTTDTTTFSYYLKSVVVDANDHVWILAAAGLAGSYRMVRYSSGNVLGSVVAINQIFEQFSPASNYAGNGQIVTLGSANLVAVPLILQHVVGSVDQARASVLFHAHEASPGSFRVDIVADDIVTDDGSDVCVPYPSLIYASPTFYIYYAWMDATPQFKIRRSCSKGGGWSTASDVFVPTSGVNQRIDLVSAREVGSGAVGILFSTTPGIGGTYTDPHYYQETPSCLAASSCASSAQAVIY